MIPLPKNVSPQQLALHSTISTFLKKRFGYKRLRFDCISESRLHGRMSKFELFLRVNIDQYYWNGLDNIFIIARVAFKERRKGHFMAFIRSILPTLEQLGMQYIGIETANPASSQFARKIGMISTDDNRNFYGSISDIKLALLNID